MESPTKQIRQVNLTGERKPNERERDTKAQKVGIPKKMEKDREAKGKRKAQ